MKTKASKRAALLIMLWLVTCIGNAVIFITGGSLLTLLISVLAGYLAWRLASHLARREVQLSRNRRRSRNRRVIRLW